MSASAGNARHQAAVTKTADMVAQLRGDIHAQLDLIRERHTYLDDLADTRQRTGLGFLTPEARALADAQTRLDRRAARSVTGRGTHLGTAWMSAAGITPGHSPAPVAITAVSASAEILFTLQHHVRRLARAAVAAAAAAVPGSHGRLPEGRPTTDGDVLALADHLDTLVDVYTNRAGLQAILRDLEQLTRTADHVVDGPARTNYPDICPWCGNRSLVVHHRAPGRTSPFIRCEGTHRCTCTDPWCRCHRHPAKHRHEWENAAGKTHTWHELRRAIAARKELMALETRALAALDVIKQLHQPHWVDTTTGETRTWHIYTDQPPADHVCRIAGQDSCLPTEGLHAIPGCIECRQTNHDGDDIAPPWPCPTHQAADLDNNDSNGAPK